MTDDTTKRIRYRDTIPIEAPESLDELTGPATGQVVPPSHIHWAPKTRTYDMGNDPDAQIVYQAFLSEGTAEDQKEFINRDRLIELWPTLSLDQRVVKLWEGRFPQLRGLAW